MQPGARRPSTLQFSTAEEVLILNKRGNHNNVRICNGKEAQILAQEDGVLAVLCARNNGGNVRPPAGGFNYTLIVQVPRNSSGINGTDLNGGIQTLVEIYGQGLRPNVTATQEGETVLGRQANVTVNQEGETVFINVAGLTVEEQISVFV